MEIGSLRSELDRLIESNSSTEKCISAKSSEVEELKNRLSEINSGSARLVAENASLRAEIDEMKKQLASRKSFPKDIAPLVIHQDHRGTRVLQSSAPILAQDSVETMQSEAGSSKVEALGEHKDLTDEVRSQINKFFATKDERFWKKTYERHLKGHNQMSKENFRLAFNELGIFLDEEGEREVFDGADTDQDEGLDFNEFLMAVKKPSKVEQWTAGLPLTKLVATAFVPIIRQSKFESDPLVALSECSASILSSVVNMLKDGLYELLWKHISDLKTGYRALQSMNLETQGHQAPSKFSIGEVGTMSCGKINDFYGGLGSRVGL